MVKIILRRRRWRRSQAEYEWALNLMGKKQYAEARVKFLSLGAFQNAESNAKECLYQPAMEALDGDGDPLAAIDAFTELDAYYVGLTDYSSDVTQWNLGPSQHFGY